MRARNKVCLIHKFAKAFPIARKVVHGSISDPEES